MHASTAMVNLLLPERVRISTDPSIEAAVGVWQSMGGDTIPSVSECGSQRAWDDRICSAISAKLLSQADSVSRARLLAATAPHSGSWRNLIRFASRQRGT